MDAILAKTWTLKQYDIINTLTLMPMSSPLNRTT